MTSEESWDNARRLLTSVKNIPSNFSSAVRTLLGHYEKNSPLTAGAQNHINRLISNNTVKATYYYCAKAYRPSLLECEGKLTDRELASRFTPIEHAIILSFCYYYRSFVKRCDKEEWEYIQAPFYEALAVGAHIGQSVPQVGLSFGLLSRGIRYLAFAAFLLNDLKGFKAYRRHLHSTDLPFDMEYELKTWGCTNIQVSVLMLEHIGFNTSIGLEFLCAADHGEQVGPDERYGTRFRIAEALVDHYMETGGIPETLPSWTGIKLSLSSDQRDALEIELQRIVSATERIEWLNKSGVSINPQSSPELFAAQPEGAPALVETSPETSDVEEECEEVMAAGIDDQSPPPAE